MTTLQPQINEETQTKSNDESHKATNTIIVSPFEHPTSVNDSRWSWRLSLQNKLNEPDHQNHITNILNCSTNKCCGDISAKFKQHLLKYGCPLHDLKT